jgi:hypothetical protein
LRCVISSYFHRPTPDDALSGLFGFS